MPSPEILGPLGLTIALGIAVGLLWREHLKADAEDRKQRDLALDLLDRAIENNRLAAAAAHESASANKAMATAWDARNRADAQRHRKAD